MTIHYGNLEIVTPLYVQAQQVCGSALRYAASSEQVMDSLIWLDEQFEIGGRLASIRIDEIRKDGSAVAADVLWNQHRYSQRLYRVSRCALVMAAYGWRHPGPNFDSSLS